MAPVLGFFGGGHRQASIISYWMILMSPTLELSWNSRIKTHALIAIYVVYALCSLVPACLQLTLPPASSRN